MAKTRNFSIYLLKKGFNASNALQERHNLKKANADCRSLPEGSLIYYGQNPPKSPWWKEYWGIENSIQQSSVGALIFLPVNSRCFVISHGNCFHNLKTNSYEYDFGILTTLNAVDPNKIKSTDLLMPETAKRQRIQIPNASNLTYFDFNSDETIVKKLTGAVKDQYKELFRNATGSSSFCIASKVEANELTTFCKRLLDIYQSTSYQSTFPDLKNVSPIKDPDILEKLNKQLLQDFNEKSNCLSLGIPDIVDYSTNFTVVYSGEGKQSQTLEDINIGDYREYLSANNIEVDNVELFKHHCLQVHDEDGTTKKKFSIYKSFLYDCNLGDITYHMCDGSWYEINTEFILRLNKELDKIFADNHDVLKECTFQREYEYNKNASIEASKGCSIKCLDTENIAPYGQTAIEPCDIIVLRNDALELIHNKISTRSSSLSHLFNQGLNSAILLRQNDEAKRKLEDLVGLDMNVNNHIREGHFRVTYGIITNKPKSLKSSSLPLFSRISLLRCYKMLKLMQIDVLVVLIKNNCDKNV